MRKGKRNFSIKNLISTALFCLLIFLCISVSADEYDGYIVKFKDTANYVSCCDEETLEPIVSEWNMYKADGEDLANLDANAIEYIEPDYILKLLDAEPDDPYYQNQWNMRMIHMPYVWGKGFSAEGIRVGVIDSGVDLDNIDLSYCIEIGKSYVDSTPDDNYGHGTKVSGVISALMNNKKLVAGMTKATIIPFKVTNSTNVSTSDIISAVYDAISDKYACDVLNISIGGTASAGTINSFNTAFEKANEKGVIVTASAGNSAKSGNPINYPASCDNVISVAAVADDMERASYSEYNEYVDVTAPGGDSEKLSYVYTTGLNSTCALTSGTSFSAPHVAAMAAIAKGIRKDINFDKMMKLIKYSSLDLGEKGRDDYYGYGLLNAENIVKMLMDNGVYLTPYIPEYNQAKKKLAVQYLNSGKTADTKSSVRVAIYDKDGVLRYISNDMKLNIKSFEEKTIEFDNVDIKNGEYAKVFCMNDWSMAKPTAETVTVFGAM